MRGPDERQAILFSYRSIEDRIPADHPLRVMRRLVDPLLIELSPRFQALYAAVGRPSIPPEQLLRALLLQVLYTIRSERQLMEQLDYNLLYRWFVGLTPDDPVWVPTVFTKNRDRLLAGDTAPPRTGEGELDLCVHQCSVQSGAAAHAARGRPDMRPRHPAAPMTVARPDRGGAGAFLHPIRPADSPRTRENGRVRHHFSATC
jgi:transposase